MINIGKIRKNIEIDVMIKWIMRNNSFIPQILWAQMIQNEIDTLVYASTLRKYKLPKEILK